MILDEILVKTTERNKDILKGEENKIHEIIETSEEIQNFKWFCSDLNNYSVKKYKNHSDDKNSEAIYEQMLKEKINKNEKGNVKHKDGSIKAEVKRDNNDDNHDVESVDKRPLHPCDKLRHQTKKGEDVVFLRKRPLHPRERVQHQTKDNKDVTFVGKRPQHPWNKVKQKTK